MGLIKDLPPLERPREKALRFGLDKLNLIELIAIILGSGTKGRSVLQIASDLYYSENGIKGLFSIDLESLKKYKGISTISALRLLSCFEIFKKIGDDLKFDHSNDFESTLNKYEKNLKDKDYETFVLIMLDSKSRVIGEEVIFSGVDGGGYINDIKLIEKMITKKCKFFYLIHNHPNNFKFPSDEDMAFTLSIIDKAKQFKIRFKDHIVISNSGKYSFLKQDFIS